MFLKKVFGDGKMKHYFKIKMKCKVVNVYVFQKMVSVFSQTYREAIRMLVKHKPEKRNKEREARLISTSCKASRYWMQNTTNN